LQIGVPVRLEGVDVPGARHELVSENVALAAGRRQETDLQVKPFEALHGRRVGPLITSFFGAVRPFRCVPMQVLRRIATR
jgi:hypothetical protein